MSNFKKMVEARMAKTGEGWQEASERVRAKAGAGDETPPSVIVSRGGPRAAEPLTMDHLTLDEIEAHRRQRGWRARLAELDAKTTLTDEERAQREEIAQFDRALELEARRRNAGRWLLGVAPPMVVTWVPDTLRRPMRRDVLVRSFGGNPDASIVVLRPQADKEELFDDALEEARREAAERRDVIELGIRRSDRPGHPWVCSWKRRAISEPWTFEWQAGADDKDAKPLDLSYGAGRTAGRESASLEIALGAFNVREVWRCLSGIHEHPLRGDGLSEEALTGKVPLGTQPGIAIRKDWNGKLRFRVTIVDPSGLGFFDELVLPEHGLAGLGAALLDRLNKGN